MFIIWGYPDLFLLGVAAIGFAVLIALSKL
jgi:hypothetical protein